ncbi:MAG: hypothetical protein CBE23_000570 [Candidatus Pelagibacter sp. TMED263]|nr:MAG: hypothetical protein CBE23_000570 [Candidatus Pelagibacter sp. TMED263]|tara:strand:- start:34 stop:468 length:435 start_codon:yes stop_codon:yes gene_type:complete
MLKLIVFFYLIFFNSYANEEYFLSLRNNEVNLRLGPSFDYPIKIIYKKKYLPVLVKDKSDNFRKIQDHENNSGWIHISQLSKKKSGITIEDIILYKRPTIYSKPLANIKTGRLLIVSKCKENWCKIKTEKYSGWVKKSSVWGRL